MERIANLSKSLTASQTPSATITRVGDNNEIGIITMKAMKTFNALTPDMRAALESTLTELSEDPQVKVVCINSAHPKVFCAGANIKEFETDTTETWLLRDCLQKLGSILTNYNKPIISAVNRMALGGGFELALHSDIIVAGDDALFGLPEITLGLFPGFGGTVLSKIVGK